MSLHEVEWVLVIFYGKSAHRATYGRLAGTTYTKDYIQLSRKVDFIEGLQSTFPAFGSSGSSIPIVYKWPNGSAEGQLIRKSADRPHLAWATDNAPSPWRMNPTSSETTVETIPGNPSHKETSHADEEFDRLMASGFGQPYLIAVKLRDQADFLHLRVQVADPTPDFAWADINKSPQEVIDLANATSQTSALAWKLFDPTQEPVLFFDPNDKVSPWKNSSSDAFLEPTETAVDPEDLDAGSLGIVDNDALAENMEAIAAEIVDFERQLDDGSYAVSDATTTAKTRGSAQRVFSKKVKENYDWRCAVTGINSSEFLIAAHIVPWSVDENIRLDPANGICLSVLIDRAFEHGHLVVEDDLTIVVDWEKIGSDTALADQLSTYHGSKLAEPKTQRPKAEYLQRRRALK